MKHFPALLLFSLTVEAFSVTHLQKRGLAEDVGCKCLVKPVNAKCPEDKSHGQRFNNGGNFVMDSGRNPRPPAGTCCQWETVFDSEKGETCAETAAVGDSKCPRYATEAGDLGGAVCSKNVEKNAAGDDVHLCACATQQEMEAAVAALKSKLIQYIAIGVCVVLLIVGYTIWWFCYKRYNCVDCNDFRKNMYNHRTEKTRIKYAPGVQMM